MYKEYESLDSKDSAVIQQWIPSAINKSKMINDAERYLGYELPGAYIQEIAVTPIFYSLEVNGVRKAFIGMKNDIESSIWYLAEANWAEKLLFLREVMQEHSEITMTPHDIKDLLHYRSMLPVFEIRKWHSHKGRVRFKMNYMRKKYNVKDTSKLGYKEVT